ncbi:ArdC family protein [Sphingomonas sp. 22176]|jgi:antirestriction protein ArdC|uniref:ArdC family protein n=1 Tax=Sphingomonas sp. 22176 TaxID=3453884 RepID=UPI003F83A8D9
MNSIAEEVTKLLLQKLEQGIVPWKRPWSLTGEGGRPLRHEGTPYTGINCPWLWSIADSRGYKSRYWMTKRQAEELGGRVRKGAEATISIYASSFRKQGKSLLTGETTAQLIRFLRSYLVYNADEIDGLPAWYYPRPVAPTPTLLSLRQEAIDAFFEQIPSVVRYGGSQAYFSPLSDHIQMPRLAHFTSVDLFASTLAHEHVHWTGARSRLDRTFGKRFGDKAYAFEELVACLGQSFICAELGLPTELHDNHASYLGSWIRVLKDDKAAVFLASTKAEQAVRYLQAFASVTPVAKAA